MRGTRLELKGFDELEAELERLAPVLTDEATPIADTAATTAVETVRTAYREITGRLRRGLRVVTVATKSYRVQRRIENAEEYALFYEFGTSRSKATPTFVPITVRARQAFKKAIVALVESKGLQVRGD